MTSKMGNNSFRRIAMATVAGVTMIASPVLAQPGSDHGGNPHGGPAPQMRGNNGGGQSGGGRPGGGQPGGGQPGGAPRNFGGGGNPHGGPAPQAQQAPQAPRPQQNVAANNGPRGGPGGGQFGGNPGGQPGGWRGNQPGGQPGMRGSDFNRGGDFNRGVNVQRGNWGPGMSGQSRQNFANNRPWDEHRGGPGGGPGGNYRAWNNGWRNDSRYDWRGWRDSHRDAYHLGRYYAPYRDYSYRRLSIGFMLDPLFYGNGYMIYDPGMYRLPDVYGPYRWVRYYNDAILVDTYTGQVVDVMYGFFW